MQWWCCYNRAIIDMEEGTRDYHSENPIFRLFPCKWSPSTITLFFILLSLAIFTALHWGFPGVSSFYQQEWSLNIGIGGNRSGRSSENRSSGGNTSDAPAGCPEYFRWIHEDLRPWKGRGISKKLVVGGGSKAHFRLVVVKGKAYVKRYRRAFQTRDVFNIWGVLQLLRLYPGMLPDLDLMFSCNDTPAIKKSDYQRTNSSSAAAPPMFGYCGNDESVVVRFPDWTFWGWPEVHIEPWEALKDKLEAGNKKVNWTEREPYAYWKGNTRTGTARRQLCRCNVTDQKDWNARIYHLDWLASIKEGFKNTNLANQCTHRYKIYVEGNTWSVSEKYILACDSMPLIVAPRYHDFYTRSLEPLTHYWPINDKDECRSLKLAVDWGNAHPQQAQKIGKAGTKFITEELKMKNVYDYMFHLLSEYAKLLRYRPTVPKGAVRVCAGTLDCVDQEEKKTIEGLYKIGSMVQGPSKTEPCKIPPPYDPPALEAFLESKEKLVRQVQSWEERGNFHEDVDG